jgi:pyrroline-5-carboxylate reductase
MPSPRLTQRLALIGAGQMAEALIGGFLDSGLLRPDQIRATDSSPERRDHVQKRFGIRVAGGNSDVASWADVVILAVKPQILPVVLDDVSSAVEGKLVISVAAGTALERIAARLPSNVRLVRAMPNAPALLREGMTALAMGEGVTDHDAEMARGLFGAVGRVSTVEESLMHAVTGLSGSGPAYAFVAIEAMADGGVKMGLPRDVAVLLATHSMLGAARMWLRNVEHPTSVEDQPTVPDGTTIAGLHELEEGKLRSALMAAVEAATERSKVLGRQCS